MGNVAGAYASSPSGYSVTDLGPIDTSYATNHEGNSVAPVGVTQAGSVLFPYAGLLSHGTYLRPSNDAAGNGDGAIYFNAINDNNIAVGELQTAQGQGYSYQAVVWTAAAGRPARVITFSRAVVPAGASDVSSDAVGVDDTGVITGLVQYETADGSSQYRYFTLSSPTADPVLATDPRANGGGPVQVIGLNTPWEVAEDLDSPPAGQPSEFRYNSSTSTSTAFTQNGPVAANGTVLANGQLFPVTGPSVTLSVPADTFLHVHHCRTPAHPPATTPAPTTRCSMLRYGIRRPARSPIWQP